MSRKKINLKWVSRLCLLLLSSLLLPAVASSHQQIPSLEDASCLKCHKTLLEKKVVHPPAMAGGCSSCHQGSVKDGKTEINLIAKGNDLCFTCHPDKQELLKKKVVHSAFKDMDCTTCHNPHGSDSPRMLSQAVPDLCINCHADKAVDKKAVTVHPPFMAGDCLSCHNPHASDIAALLQEPKKEEPKKGEAPKKDNRWIDSPVNKLCFTCHDRKNLLRHPIGRGHYLAGKPDPLKTSRDISCVSCHNPHQSGHKWLFYDSDNETMMCIGCHSKIQGNRGRFTIK